MEDREAAALAKALSNPLRLRFIRTLQGRGEKDTLSRGEFSNEMSVPVHNLEMHIDVLRSVRVLKVAEPPRREHHYSLDGSRGGVAAALVDLLAGGREQPLDYREAAATASALGHPTRVAYLRAVGRRGRKGLLSPSEFARESGEEDHIASYHVGVLRNGGVVAVAEMVRQHGAPVYRYSVCGPRGEVAAAMVELVARA